MQKYRCKVRLAGGVNNEVPKVGVYAAEIIVLRAMHGADSVVAIEPMDMDKKPHSELRDELQRRYPRISMERLFGPSHQSLPVRLDPATEAQIAEQVAAKEADLTAAAAAQATAAAAEDRIAELEAQNAILTAAVQRRDEALAALQKVDRGAVNGDSGGSAEVVRPDPGPVTEAEAVAPPQQAEQPAASNLPPVVEQAAEDGPVVDKNGPPPPPAGKSTKAKK